MTAARSLQRISIQDYLDDELISPVKHEYLGGATYLRPDTTNAHNLIAGNFLGAAGSRLRAKRCQVFNSDTKVRVRLATQTRFYYPDGMIVCRPNPQSDTFQDNPVVVAEVVSPATRRTDEGEKKDAYLTIPSLAAYLLIETDRPRVVVHRRGPDGAFAAELYDPMTATVALDDANCSIRLADLYDRVEFDPAASARPENGA